MRRVFQDLIAGLGLKHKQRKDLRSLIQELEHETNVQRGKVIKKLEQPRLPVFWRVRLMHGPATEDRFICKVTEFERKVEIHDIKLKENAYTNKERLYKPSNEKDRKAREYACWMDRHNQ